jgi:hypothetical protein
MIDEVDDAIRALLKREALNGADVEVAFDAPSRDWSTRRNAPTIDVYLYDIREDTGRRTQGSVDIRNGEGRIIARRGPPRYFTLSYLVTAWTQRPEDEHRLLSAVLRCFLRMDTFPPDVVGGNLDALGYPLGVTIAKPPSGDRSISDIWSALGGDLKPSLDLVVTVAVDAVGLAAVAPLVLEEAKISLRALGETEPEDGDREPVVPQKTVKPGTGARPKRAVRKRSTRKP